MAALSNLFPVIAQSFVVILIGYLFGRFGLIDPREARSITTLVGKLALPALLFRNLAILDLSLVSWPFMGSIVAAKFIVFLVVVILSLIITRKLGQSGLYGIFSTQSNDFALGLPIVQALYSSSTNDDGFHFSSYIYLFAPISLAIINPIGFFMLEYSKQVKNSHFSIQRIPIIIGRTLFYLIINPLILMTLLGLLVNVIRAYGFHQSIDLPSWLDNFLLLLAGAYAPCALFNIGLFMVGRLNKVTGYTIFISGLLIFAKSILLPLIGYVSVNLFLPNHVSNSSVEDIASFGFLYCTFPTAPTVFIYASQYSIAVPIIASSVVFGTFISAPLMYVSARMVLITTAEESTYKETISITKLNSSAISMICLVWVFFLFVISRRYRSYLHIIMMHLMVAQFIECLGSILLDNVGQNNYWGYLFFSVFFIGVFASRLWLAWLSLGIVVLIKKGINTANKIWWPMLFSSWGIPILTTVIMVAASKPHGVMNPSFMFGTSQLVISAFFLLLAFTVGLVCVIIIVIHVNKPNLRRSQSPPVDQERVRLLSKKNSTDISESVNSLSTKRETSPEISENTIRFNGYQFIGVGTWERDESGKSLTPFLVIVVFLLFSCLVGILVVIWQLVNDHITGVFIAAQVLDNVTNFGQGFFVFVVFGFEKHWFWKVVYQKIRKYFFKIEIVILPEEAELSGPTVTLCNQFKVKCLAQCKTDIVSDKRYYFQVFPSVFTGSDFVEWLISQRLVDSVDEAIDYGEALLEGRVIRHLLGEHYFHNEDYFYEFLV